MIPIEATARARTLLAAATPCDICGAPATCFGRTYGGPSLHSCDACCGHSAEDGECEPVNIAPASALTDVLSLADALATAERERDTLRRERAAVDAIALEVTREAMSAGRRDADVIEALTAERDTARAEAAGLRAESAVLIAERDDARLMSRCNHDNWRGALAEVDALQAIIEGRTSAPTDAELDAHEAVGGSWLYRGPGGSLGGRSYARGTSGEPEGGGLPILVRSTRRSAELGEPLGRWWALDADGRPCAWPEVRDG